MSSRCISWPAPAGEVPSAEFSLAVDGAPVFVYAARVRAEILDWEGLWSHKPDWTGEPVGFAIFDITGPVQVTVRPGRAFKSAAVYPARAGIVPAVDGDGVTFTVERPQHLTVILDGMDTSPLHLFIGAPETDVPRPDDPSVIYFAPGVHEIETLIIPSGATVYLAGGAVVKGVLRAGEQPEHSEKWNVDFYNGCVLALENVEHVTVRGRGILDGSAVPHPGRNLIRIHGARDVQVSGITLRDSPNWNVVISQSAQVDVDDVRIISARLNSDGINSVNARDVTISRCFVRNHDDSIAVKATVPDMPCEHIRVEDCVIWNDWGYALGPTYEMRSPVRDIVYRHCDILSAAGHCLGVRVGDSQTVSDITFTDIAIADLVTAPHRVPRKYIPAEPDLLELTLTNDCWSTDVEPGRIRDITVEHITQGGDHLLASHLRGMDAEHGIRGVTFRNIHLAGHPAAADAQALNLHVGEYVEDVAICAE